MSKRIEILLVLFILLVCLPLGGYAMLNYVVKPYIEVSEVKDWTYYYEMEKNERERKLLILSARK